MDAKLGSTMEIRCDVNSRPDGINVSTPSTCSTQYASCNKVNGYVTFLLFSDSLGEGDVRLSERGPAMQNYISH